MSRPLHRGVSGIRVPDNIHDDTWDSQSKDKSEKDDFDKRGSSDHTPLALRSPLKLLFSDKENGFTSDPFIVGTPRSRFKLLLFSLKFSLVFIVVLALVGSFWWTLNLSSSSRVRVYHGYRRLQEKLVSDLLDIGEISRGVSRWKELESCSPEFENFVPCFNVSDDNGFERKCEYEQRQNCLVLPPVNYKVPLRWPTGKDVIWVANVKITAQEVLSSGSLTKR
ncbi:putative pectin methyltransferase QUA2-like [Trifolium medium]|uniref:Methyltransferase n=1 Tax=Trifolium medium TaxID=97028 RepID=A0A392MUW7_9FABA|nr:putative pectin methyltransferase QUA2-like [Trifolium medium]